MNGPARLVVAAGLAILTANSAFGQVNARPTPDPIVSAQNDAWYLNGEPVTYEGNVYYPAGPQAYFNRYEMVRSGFFRGVPLYTRTTIEPYSIVFVPLGNGMPKYHWGMSHNMEFGRFSLYGLLDGTAPRLLGVTALLVGLTLSAGGLAIAGRRVRRTTYRPDPWRSAEWAVALCGVVSAAVMVAASSYDPLLLHPSLDPLRWPDLPVVPLLAVLVGVLPAWLAPRPERALATVRPVAVAA